MKPGLCYAPLASPVPEPEWLYEDGIGECRAALVSQGRIVEYLSSNCDDGVAAGAIVPVRLVSSDGNINLVMLAGGEQALLSAQPPRTGIGANLLVEVTRSSIPERDLVKRAKCRPARIDAAPIAALSIKERIDASGQPVRILHSHEPDLLEQAGWGELCDAAATGQWPFPGGMLRLSLTPAMTVIDVDGTLSAADLAKAGAIAAAAMILAMGIGGNIVIDLPTTASKAERIAAAVAFDMALPLPFERTGVNGYGLMQVIRPRSGPSLAERWQFSKVAQSALTLLRRAQRHAAHSKSAELTLVASPAEILWITERPELVEALVRSSGRAVHLRADPACSIGCGHVS